MEESDTARLGQFIFLLFTMVFACATKYMCTIQYVLLLLISCFSIS